VPRARLRSRLNLSSLPHPTLTIPSLILTTPSPWWAIPRAHPREQAAFLPWQRLFQCKFPKEQAAVVLTDRRLVFLYQDGELGGDWTSNAKYLQQSFFVKVACTVRPVLPRPSCCPCAVPGL
jgi:hypothetical protein